MPFFDSKKSLFDTCVLLLGRVSIGLGQVVNIRVITEFVSPSQLGLYYYVLAIGSIISPLLFQPISIYAGRTFLIWFKDKSSKSMLLAILKLLMYFTLFFCIVFFCYWHYFHEKGDIGLPYFTLVPVILLTSSIIGIVTSIINLLLLRKLFVILTNLTVWSNVLCICLLVVLVSRNAETILLGMMISQAIVAIIVLYVVKGKLDANEPIRSTQKMDWKEAWNFCWPVIITQVLFWAQNYGYRIPLKINANVSNLAVFCITYGITVQLFSLFQTVFTQLYDPLFWKSVADSGHKSSDLDNYMKNHWPYLIMFTFWTISISIFALRVMAAEQYIQYYYIVMLASVTELVRHMGLAFYNSVYAANVNKILIPPGVFSLIMCMGGTYVLGKVMDPVIATILSLGIACLGVTIIVGVFIRKSLTFKLPWKQSGIAFGFGIVLAGLCLALSLSWLSFTVVGSVVGLAISGILFAVSSFCMSRVLLKV